VSDLCPLEPNRCPDLRWHLTQTVGFCWRHKRPLRVVVAEGSWNPVRCPQCVWRQAPRKQEALRFEP